MSQQNDLLEQAQAFDDEDIFETNAERLKRKFWTYHRTNPHVYRQFCAYTWELIRAGRTRLGSQMIIERMRWESAVTGDDGFKINNNYAAYYARLFEAQYPQFKGYFTTRKLRG